MGTPVLAGSTGISEGKADQAAVGRAHLTGREGALAPCKGPSLTFPGPVPSPTSPWQSAPRSSLTQTLS